MLKHDTRWLLLSLLVGVLGCNDAGPINQAPIHHVAYISIGSDDQTMIDVLDTEFDSIVVRIRDESVPFAIRLGASPNGKVIAALNPQLKLSIFDAGSYLRLNYASTDASSVSLVGKPLRLLGHSGADSTRVYNIPDLAMDTVWHRRLAEVKSIGDGSEFLALSILMTGSNDDPQWGAVRMNAQSGIVADSFSFTGPLVGSGVYPLALAISPDESKIYLICGDSEGLAVLAFEIESHACLFRRPIATAFGDLAATRDGQDIWVTQGFNVYHSPQPKHLGYILILDATTGYPKDTIRTLGLRTDQPNSPLSLARIVAHPSEDKVYVAARSGHPGLLVIDTKTRTIEKSLYHHDDLLFDVCLAPR